MCSNMCKSRHLLFESLHSDVQVSAEFKRLLLRRRHGVCAGWLERFPPPARAQRHPGNPRFPHPLEWLGHRCLGDFVSKCRAVLRLGLRSNSSMINNCHDAFLLFKRLRAWMRVRSRARSRRCTGVLASAGAGWAALSSGSTRSKTVRHPTAFAPPNRRDYQIGSRGAFARLTLGRCATTVGFGYAVTGASAGLSGDEDRVGPIMQALQGTPCLATASQAKL